MSYRLTAFENHKSIHRLARYYCYKYFKKPNDPKNKIDSQTNFGKSLNNMSWSQGKSTESGRLSIVFPDSTNAFISTTAFPCALIHQGEPIGLLVSIKSSMKLRSKEGHSITFRREGVFLVILSEGLEMGSE